MFQFVESGGGEDSAEDENSIEDTNEESKNVS